MQEARAQPADRRRRHVEVLDVLEVGEDVGADLADVPPLQAHPVDRLEVGEGAPVDRVEADGVHLEEADRSEVVERLRV